MLSSAFKASGKLAVVLAACGALGNAAWANDDVDLARRILDDGTPREEREAIVREHPDRAVELVAAMLDDLEAGTPEEYRRIPWIWRVAVAAGRRNDVGELRRLLDLSLPAPDAPLEDWQAVVVGGGVINGITLAGSWPDEVVGAALDGHPALLARWNRSLELASEMADDEGVPTGTRYDALRMIALEPWDRRGGQLFRYLLKGVDPELQQGSVSALADMRAPAAAQALLSGFDHYNETNRDFTLDGLLRDPDRVAVLLDAIAAGRIGPDQLGPERVERLMHHSREDLRTRAIELLGR